MEDFKNRLLAFIEGHCKTSIRAFEEDCGLTNGTVASVRKKGPGADIVQKIFYTHPELNLNWLFSGVGPMLNGSHPSEAAPRSLPLIPLEAFAVPASPRLLAILERNGGHAPHLAQQHLNEWIKRACKAVGIDGRVEVSSYDGKCRKTEIRRKYECVSSHCASRSGITLLYMTGIPLQQVMLISGHKDQDSIRHYLRLSKEENVAMLKDNPFFK